MNNKYYIHIKSGNEYKVLSETIIKIDGVWHDGVIYQNVPYSRSEVVRPFVRLKEDFLSKFKERFYDPEND